MSAATIRETRPAERITGVGELAVRAGLALERWGRRRTATTPSRDDLVRLIGRRRQAHAARAANEGLVFRATGRG